MREGPGAELLRPGVAQSGLWGPVRLREAKVVRGISSLTHRVLMCPARGGPTLGPLPILMQGGHSCHQQRYLGTQVTPGYCFRGAQPGSEPKVAFPESGRNTDAHADLHLRLAMGNIYTQMRG